MSPPCIFITGGNGYIGMRLAKAILVSSEFNVQLYVHAANDSELQTKTESLKAEFSDFLKEKRLRLCGGELSSQEPFKSVDKSEIQQIIHSAAVTRFTVEEDLANRINVEGSDRLLSFAETCNKLQSLQFLSTIYAAGLREGAVEEQQLDRASSFSNHYERSKWEAERLLQEKYSHLPVNILRIATLIADNKEGVVSQQNAFHNTLKLFYYGLLSLFPGKKETPIYFVSGDFVLSSIMAVIAQKSTGKVYHVCHSQEETATLEELVEVVFSTFETYQDFRTRRVLRPLWSDLESFELLQQGMAELSGAVLNQALSSVAPFARQLFAPKAFRNDKIRNLLPHYEAPDPRLLIANTARYLADTKWGRQLQNAK